MSLATPDQRDCRNMLTMKPPMASTRKTTNRICAIPAAPAARPVKPNSAAMRAMTKNTMRIRNLVQRDG